MQTRSEDKKELTVEIDFDYASSCWNQNKIKLGPGSYKYVCGKKLKNGNFCKNNRCKNYEYCYKHYLNTSTNE
jgi:hypothetical protein